MEDGTLYKALFWVGGLLMSVLGYIGMGMRVDIKDSKDKIDDLEKNSLRCELRLADFKTEVARDYAKDVNVQASIGRLHDCMEIGFKEIRTDIKLLIGGKK